MKSRSTGVLTAALLGMLSFAALTPAAEPSLRIEDRGALGFRLEITLPRASLEQGTDGTNVWGRARLGGFSEPERPGVAVLPELNRLVAVPRGASLDWTWEPGATIVLGAAPPPRVPDAGVSPTLAVPVVSLEPVGVVRHLNLARLSLRPVVYDPRTGLWSQHTSLTVNVRFSTAGLAHPIEDLRDSVDEALGRRVLNPGALRASASTSGSGGALEASSTATIPAPEPSVMTPLKIQVRETGIHEVTHADLTAAGVDPSGVDPSTFVLTLRGVEVALDMDDGGDGSFDAGDRFRFYGEALDSEETWDNIYRLTGGVRAGLRMGTRDMSPDSGAPVPAAFRNTAYRETDILYFASPPSEISPWYWDKLAVTSPGTPVFVDYDLILSNVSSDGSLTGRLEVHVQSRRETPGPSPNHHVRVYLNGNLVDDQTWTGLQGVTLGADVPQSWIVEGTNTVRVENPADLGLSTQEEWTDWIRLEYHDQLVAESDYLAFDLATTSAQRIQVTGFGGSDVIGYDVTDPKAPLRLTGLSVQPDGTGWRAELSNDPGTPAGPLVLLRPGAGRTPFGFVVDQPSTLRDDAATGADLLIVVHEDFESSLAPLVAHRRAEGWRVVVGRLTDVYDEFNGGIAESQGIRNFVQWAFENYAPPAPSYLLLVGDATFDPKDYKGQGDNYVPTHMYYQEDFGYSPTDTWFAAVSGGDLIPDLAVGRLTPRSITDIQDAVGNVVDYETLPLMDAVSSGLLYVADDDDAAFESLLEDLIAKFHPPAMEVRRVYLNNYPQSSSGVNDATQDIRDAIDTGSLITTYAGHGGRKEWATEKLWEVSDVATLQATDRLTFVLALNCINGYFANTDAEPYSLGEEWMRRSDRGAVGNWAPAATGTLFNYDVLGDEFFHHVFDLKQTRLGYAAWQALLDSFLLDNVPLRYVRQMIYFGDPLALARLDSDRDGLHEQDELDAGTDPDDADSDEDGLLDADEPSWNTDADGDGRVNAADPDADDDGLPDGLEAGLTSAPPATDVSAGWFVADADPSTTTDPLDPDSDGGGAPDGVEDRDADGLVDPGETDPNNPLDDPACAASAPAEVTGLLVSKSGSDLVLSWDDQSSSDPCVLYQVYVATDAGRPDARSKFEVVATVASPSWTHAGALGDGRDYHYLVRARSLSHGDGPLGHYGE